ncbi:MFS transporter [Plastorhodobacter daqingensis]|uniref:MFS transporter n=1 Tax=Plastorhodobacter daqingensis TaxID=1387281 RepID=A0ABW2UP85_9RHOB
MSQFFRPTRPLVFAEFVGLMAALFALAALSIDAMLPALPQIAQDLSPEAPNRAQLVVTSFVLGLGIGMMMMGALSDALGRKPVIALGIGLYIIGSGLAALADSLPLLLAARMLQGLGISAPRTVGVAMIRDLYQGRIMARVMSIVMTIFILVPAAAPFIGQTILLVAGWRMIFMAFIAFGLFALVWMSARQPETLAPERRRPFRLGSIWSSLREVMIHRRVQLYIIAMTLGFGQLFALLSAAQPIYDVYYGRGDSFAAWFALQALLAGTAGLVNAALVVRLGMRRIVVTAFATQVVISSLATFAWATGLAGGEGSFPIFFLWTVSVFFMAGVTFGNLNTLALEPMGHIAGMAAAAVGAVSTVLAVLVAAPIGLAFDGTPLPLMIGVLSASGLALAAMIAADRFPG